MKSPSRFLLAMFIVAAAFAVLRARPALAQTSLPATSQPPGSNDDVLLLANGGRVRGVVMAEDPVKGVRIKLLDGSVRNVPPAEVKEVRYAGSQPPPATDAAAAPPGAAQSPPETPQPPAAPAPESAAASAPPVALGVPVRFEPSSSGSRYHVQIDQAGKPPHGCDAPCTLTVDPGAAEVTITGDASFKQAVQVTPATTAFEVSRRKTGLVVGGVVLEVLGLGILAVGAAQQSLGIIDVLLCAGLAGAGAGMVAVAGSNDVKALVPTPSQPPRTSALRFQGVSASPLPNGGGIVGASFSF